MLEYDFATGELISPSGRVLDTFATVDQAAEHYPETPIKGINIALAGA